MTRAEKTVAELQNDRLLRALRREPVDVTPVWMMRQAGRYLPEYRSVREAAGSFLRLCTTPELACEVTLQPLARYPLDAAIIFSDILTVPHAMGLGLDFVAGEGPRLAHPVRSPRDIRRLPRLEPEADLGYVLEALRLTRRELAGRAPLVGFAGSPWTVACYMIEGRSGNDFPLAKRMLYEAPGDLHRLLERLAAATLAYVGAQIDAGAQALMLFDTWGGSLTARGYAAFSLAYCRRILEGLRAVERWGTVPVVLFTKGGASWLEAMADAGFSALGLDWTIELAAARARVGDRAALQGNMDPAALRAPPARIEAEVGAVLESYGPGPGHVFNLGHGITPDVAPERVGVAVAAVHRLSRRYHAGAGSAAPGVSHGHA